MRHFCNCCCYTARDADQSYGIAVRSTVTKNSKKMYYAVHKCYPVPTIMVTVHRVGMTVRVYFGMSYTLYPLRTVCIFCSISFVHGGHIRLLERDISVLNCDMNA